MSPSGLGPRLPRTPGNAAQMPGIKGALAQLASQTVRQARRAPGLCRAPALLQIGARVARSGRAAGRVWLTREGDTEQGTYPHSHEPVPENDPREQEHKRFVAAEEHGDVRGVNFLYCV